MTVLLYLFVSLNIGLYFNETVCADCRQTCFKFIQIKKIYVSVCKGKLTK